MRVKLQVLLITLLVSSLAVGEELRAQTATDILSEEVQTVLENMIGVSIDRQLKIADIGSEVNVGVGILHRTGEHDTDGGNRGIIHAYVTEVYIILSGGGTLLTGGTLTNATEPSASGADNILIGPTFSADSSNGVVREIEEGDIVIIPAGTLHAWTSIPDSVTYLSVRVDPDQHLPAGYVNPEID